LETAHQIVRMSEAHQPTSAADRVPGPRPPISARDACELALRAKARGAILVEGWSDEAAVNTLARRRGYDLQAEGIVVIPIAGATNFHSFVEALGAHGIRLSGLYDIAEEHYARLGLERAGLGTGLTRADMEALGFFACDADLEDEMIRTLGNAGVERILDVQGELQSFRSFQNQPAQRGGDCHAQLRRFLGIRSGRKIRYGSLLTEALDLAQVPRSLDRVLAHARMELRTSI
jgi:hypothetical protein